MAKFERESGALPRTFEVSLEENAVEPAVKSAESSQGCF